MKTALAIIPCLALCGCAGWFGGGSPAAALRAEDFYEGGTFGADSANAGGKFRPEAAAAAYAAAMKKLGYNPAPCAAPGAAPKIECTDYRRGSFLRLGAGVFRLANEIREEYGARDIVLLPWQSTVECSHVAARAEGTDGRRRYVKDVPCKMATWLVRRGTVYAAFSKGSPNFDAFPELKSRISACPPGNAGGTGAPHSVHVEKWTADGKTHKLPGDETWYFFTAGPEGAVVSEFSNYHAESGTRRSLPGAAF